MTFVVLYDACVLHPAPVRDLLVRLGRTGLFRARWSERILDECFRSILNRRPDLNHTALSRTRQLMIEALPGCMVRGFEPLIDGLALPDPDDRHVLAAAIKTHAQVIVTANLADFPPDRLSAFGIEAKHPDEFVLDLIDLSPAKVTLVLHEQAASLRSPPRTLDDLLDTLQGQDLVRTVAKVRELLDLHP